MVVGFQHLNRQAEHFELYETEQKSGKAAHLYFRQNGHHRNDDTEDKVEADEDFVFSTFIGFCVVHVEQHHSSKGQCIVQDGKEQEAYAHKPVVLSFLSGVAKYPSVILPVYNSLTEEPAFAVALLSVSHPHLIPRMGKVNQ